MSINEKIKELEKRGWLSTNPRPIFVFLLFLAYFLMWLVIFILYLKFDMTYLRIWIIILGIISFITLMHAIAHAYTVKVIEADK